ncbi:29825_t:CDS:2, partial [Racocetra persica]
NEREQAINILHEVYENYKPAEENQSLLLPATKSTCDLFCNLINCSQVNKNQYEITTYLSEPETKAEPLLWWKANPKQYLTLSHVTIDFLAVQATSIASEQAFSVTKDIAKAFKDIATEVAQEDSFGNQYQDQEVIPEQQQ